jgi:hypothetical protein
MLLSAPYQGNGWWAMFGLGSLCMLSYVLLRARRRRKAGLPVDVRDTIVGCLFFLGFFTIAVFQVLSHQ